MKLKKILKYLDEMADFEIRTIGPDGEDNELYSGYFWDIPESLKKRELDIECGDERAIYIASEINEHGARIDKFVIYVTND